MSLNTTLKNKLEAHFSDLGIVAYSDCCLWGCTGSYGGDYNDFKTSEKGIYYICFYLDGMNYNPNATYCYAQYVDFDYLVDNWDQQKEHIDDFCKIIGLTSGEYSITKPPNKKIGVKITFYKSLNLDDFEPESD